jgi:hypothetical protein
MAAGYSEHGMPESVTERILFEDAVQARTNRLSAQNREQYSNEYRRKKAYWWAIEAALVGVIEKSGLIMEFAKYEKRYPVSPDV